MDDIVVTKHGDSYNEQDELMLKYPCLPCPECGSLDVHIKWIQNLHAKRSGIYEYERFRISYSCVECGCNFRYDYTDESNKRLAEISEIVFWGVVSFPIGVLSIFSTVCSLVAYNPGTASAIQSLLFVLWALPSMIIAASAITLFFMCLGEGF